MDATLRTICLWIAVACAALALVSMALPNLRRIDFAATMFAASVALLLFLRMLFSPYYRRGVDRINAEMRSDAPWPGRRIRLFDHEWGLFGKKCGGPILLWARAVLVTGMPILALTKSGDGDPVVQLWFFAGFISIELSIMFAAISAQSEAS